MDIWIEQDNAPYRWSTFPPEKRIANLSDPVVRVYGGEPFFKNKIHRILESYDQSKKFIIETNATRLSKENIKKIKNKNIELEIKIDGTGKLQEYLRPGLVWDQIENSLELLLEEKISFTITPTLHVFNIIHIEEFIRWCRSKSYNLNEPIDLKYPKELSANNLPYQLHEQVPSNYKNLLKQDTDCFNLINQLDNRHRQSIVNYLPEWNKVFTELHWKDFEKLKYMDKELDQYVG